WNGGLGWQLLVVPRRELESGNLLLSESSIALKAHHQRDESEWEFMGAFHYDEAVLGLGHLGYFGNAVWRWDTTVAFPHGEDPLWSTVANIDYSWNWKGINYYGSLEMHYNTAGVSDYGALPDAESLLARIERGEMHTLGRAYLAPSLQVELHPLFNLYIGAIVNLGDPSAVALPRLVWNVRQNMEITIGGNCYFGSKGTEFGGLPVPAIVDTTEVTYLAYPDRLYLWVKAYF
ncbi:MAG TPA: hypothetical protein VK995_02505, partial [Oceanipulchritudo sp.]|nr:hypothetical protein [Oceanipulchritudo sp.]